MVLLVEFARTPPKVQDDSGRRSPSERWRSSSFFPLLSGFVFEKGAAGDYLGVLFKGRLKVTLLGEMVRRRSSTSWSRPLLGNIALLDEATRLATVVTLEASEFLHIGRARSWA